MIIAVIFNTLILIVYASLVLAILYHYRKYSLLGDRYRWVVNIFLMTTIILFVLSYLIIIFFIDWESLKPENLREQNFFRIF
ncbi:MAG: hypothetical protein A3H02_01320 [Candidatus Niyogibacteria bacterium RIFCSPLOWO2_12_FULL_41_13]|uniref:DUF5671 domain-containing protein n=1 Tax=Candidatus Niyogibacteria bacterium RIFCSPLOWO2_12_FULL_41_13 TaxID=1801726 RepID=A0A1G2F0Z2_9BACT|nr:MAG: hypothetical protein A3H02_01320 [Candidatus Niyogibacteria bacterium RIFCSPLOWO2_12_FULL_41_13]